MGQRFNGNVWFQKQVAKRTRAVLLERGEQLGNPNELIKTQMYIEEYQKQERIFCRERKEKKWKKAQLWEERKNKSKANSVAQEQVSQ